MTGQAQLEHLDEDAILDLIHGSRSGERRRLALAHVRACPACEDRLRLHAADHERSVIAGARVLGHAPPAREDRAAAGRWSRLPSLSRPRPVFALAAAAAVITIILLVPRPERIDPALASQLRWLPDATSLLEGRGASATPEDAWRDGLRTYADHDARQAARLLERGRADGTLGVLRDAYLGSALAHAGDYRRAVAVLEAMPLATIPEPWAGESQWTLYVALRGASMSARADSVLAALATRPDSIGARARAVRGGSNPR